MSATSIATHPRFAPQIREITPALPVSPGLAPRTYSIFDLARRFGSEKTIRGTHRSITWLCSYFTGLQDKFGFPRPLPAMKAGLITDQVVPESRWSIPAVDQWFLDYMPPEAAAAIDTRQIADHADALDANAAGLVA